MDGSAANSSAGGYVAGSDHAPIVKLEQSVITSMVMKKAKKAYNCSQCGKIFSRRSHLMSHERTHSGSKPFFCTICFKRFTQSGSLNRHMRNHEVKHDTKALTWPCSCCSLSFSSTRALSEHFPLCQSAPIAARPTDATDAARLQGSAAEPTLGPSSASSSFQWVQQGNRFNSLGPVHERHAHGATSCQWAHHNSTSSLVDMPPPTNTADSCSQRPTIGGDHCQTQFHDHTPAPWPNIGRSRLPQTSLDCSSCNRNLPLPYELEAHTEQHRMQSDAGLMQIPPGAASGNGEGDSDPDMNFCWMNDMALQLPHMPASPPSSPRYFQRYHSYGSCRAEPIHVAGPPRLDCMLCWQQFDNAALLNGHLFHEHFRTPSNSPVRCPPAADYSSDQQLS